MRLLRSNHKKEMFSNKNYDYASVTKTEVVRKTKKLEGRFSIGIIFLYTV